MKSFWRLSSLVSVICLTAAAVCVLAQQQPQPTAKPATKPAVKPASTAPSASSSSSPQVNEWSDNFDGAQLDAEKWERFSFQGASGGKLKIEEGVLRMRGVNNSRSGIRSKHDFTGDRFIFEGTITNVEMPLPAPDEKGTPLGTAVLAIMFDGSGRNRIEWMWTSEKTLEAWAVVDGAGERLDNRKLGTKLKNPTLGIVRRGDEFFFMLNGQEGLSKTIKNLPRTFRVMLYGWSSSENNWDSVRVVTAR